MLRKGRLEQGLQEKTCCCVPATHSPVCPKLLIMNTAITQHFNNFAGCLHKPAVVS